MNPFVVPKTETVEKIKAQKDKLTSSIQSHNSFNDFKQRSSFGMYSSLTSNSPSPPK